MYIYVYVYVYVYAYAYVYVYVYIKQTIKLLNFEKRINVLIVLWNNTLEIQYFTHFELNVVHFLRAYTKNW